MSYIRSFFIKPKLTLEVDLKKNTISDKETDVPSPGDSQSRNIRDYHIRVNNAGKATPKIVKQVLMRFTNSEKMEILGS